MSSPDFIEKFTVKLNNKKPVEVTDFLKSINAFQKEYRNVCKKEGLKYDDDSVKLYIQVREGSVEWEFVRQAGQLILLDAHVYLLKKTADILIEKILKSVIDGKEPEVNDPNSLANARDFVTVQKNDKGSNISLTHQKHNGDIYNYNNCTFTGVNARGAIDFIDDSLKNNNAKTDNAFTNEVLELTVTEKNQIKGKISSISEDPKVIVFKDGLRSEIITDNSRNPLTICYIVNGNIKNAGDKIVAYEITELVETISDTDDSNN